MDFLRSGIGEGLNQATGTVLNTGMDLMKFKQQKSVQDQQLSLQNERAQRERLIFEREEQKRQEAEARYNAPVTASKFFPKIREFPSFRQSLKDGFDALGLPYEETPDGDVIAKQGHGQEVLKWIAESGERSEAQARGIFGDLQSKKMVLLEQLQSAKKPEDQKALNDQIAQISEQQAAVVNSTWDMQKEMEKKRIAQEATKPTTDIQEYEYAKQDGYRGSFEQWQLQNKKASASGGGAKGSSKEDKALKEELARLDEFLENHKDTISKQAKTETLALKAKLINGTVKPGTVVYPDTATEDGRLVHGAKGEALKGKKGKDKFGYAIGEEKQGYKYIGNDQWQKL